MDMPKPFFRSIIACISMLVAMLAFAGGVQAKSEAALQAAKLDKDSCLKCHDAKQAKIKVPVIIDGEADERELRRVDPFRLRDEQPPPLQLERELQLPVGLAQPLVLNAQLVGPALGVGELGFERRDPVAQRITVERAHVAEHALSS